MKKILCFFMLFTLFSHLHAQTTIRFAPLPMEKSITVLHQFKELIDFLQKETKIKIEIVYSASYKEMIKKFTQHKIDIAYLGPLPYVSLMSQYKHLAPMVQFLNQNGSQTYTCTLFSRQGISIPLKNLKNTNIALTQKLSTCGYLFVEDALNQNNSTLDVNHYRYAGSHTNSILNVLLGESDLGGAKTSIVNKYLDLGVKPILKSSAYPGFVLVANSKTLSKKTIQLLNKALAKLNPNKNKNFMQITKKWDKKLKYGAVPVDIKKFQELKKTCKKVGLKVD